VRLLYLTPTAAMGGAERVLLDLMAMVRREEPSWPVALVLGNDGPLADDARRLGVATTVLPFPRDFAQLGDSGLATPATWARFARHAVGGSIGTLRYIQRLRATIAAFRPDVVHSNGIKMHLLGALARPSGASLIWHFHDYPSSRPVTNRLVKSLKQRCDGVVAVSESVAADIRQELGPAVHVHTIWNSVDLDRFAPKGPRLDLDALAGLPPAPAGLPRIGLVATFARWKGHLLFLDMLKALSTTHRFRAYIVGGPLYETHASQFSMEELRAAVAQRGLSESVGLTGFVNDSAAALRSLDIVVHASTAPEPFGLVIAEAMAAARAVVISDAGGVAELVVPGQTGLRYNSGNVEQMTAHVRTLLDNASLRSRLGQAAHAAAVEQFHPSRVSAQMLGLYASFQRVRAAA
jgi:glycosyltransferase involved in cell wall biosynthesis